MCKIDNNSHRKLFAKPVFGKTHLVLKLTQTPQEAYFCKNGLYWVNSTTFWLKIYNGLLHGKGQNHRKDLQIPMEIFLAPPPGLYPMQKISLWV